MSRILFLLFSSLVFAQNTVEIQGYTNVNSFKCINEKVYVQKENTYDALQIKEINVKVEEFQCDSRKMTEQFREMMNAEKNPLIRIEIQSHSAKTNNKIQTVSNVTLNGNQKRYNLPVVFNGKTLKINQWMNIKHFDLVPPRILGGLVKVKDEVHVKVTLSDF